MSTIQERLRAQGNHGAPPLGNDCWADLADEAAEIIEDYKAATGSMRGALIACGRSAGGALADSVSTEFLMHVPEQVKLRLDAVERERDDLKARLAENWRPIGTADRSLMGVLEFPGIPSSRHSYPIWCRSNQGEPFEASWVRTEGRKEYWWAWDLEDVVEPDEWLPHPFSRTALRTIRGE